MTTNDASWPDGEVTAEFSLPRLWRRRAVYASGTVAYWCTLAWLLAAILPPHTMFYQGWFMLASLVAYVPQLAWAVLKSKHELSELIAPPGVHLLFAVLALAAAFEAGAVAPALALVVSVGLLVWQCRTLPSKLSRWSTPLYPPKDWRQER
jgi:hypothetical protein